MHTSVQNLNSIKNKVNEILDGKQQKTIPHIIAVTKTFSLNQITPLLDIGHVHFGENKIQEAENKWVNIRNHYKHLQLHMIGKLQSNKAKKAVELFDYIHSLDNQKLADTLSKAENDFNKKLNYFIQVNLGQETQKSGINVNELDNFYNYCVKEKKLNVIGLMVIPPNDGNQKKYFKYLYEMNASLGLKELSMGMSADYLDAVKYNATFLRIGSSIFGERV